MYSRFTGFTWVIVCLWLTAAACTTLAAEQGLVGHWTFDEGKGTLAKDSSGNNINGLIKGGAVFVKRGDGFALKLDGEDDFVDCRKRRLLAVESAGSVELWFNPEEFQGGLVNWSTGGGWNDERLVLAFNTYSGGNDLMTVTADGQGYSQQAVEAPQKGVWNHFVLTFDSRRMILYRDGAPRQSLSVTVRPKLKGVPFWVGKCQGLGKATFKGLIDEVRVYNRPLSAQEVLARYKKQAVSFGKDTTAFFRPVLKVEALPDPGRIVAHADYALMEPLPTGAQVEVEVRRGAADKPLARGQQKAVPRLREAVLNIAAGQLPRGKYQVRAIVKDAAGKPFGKPSVQAVDWPGQSAAFKDVKILNNIVWELLNAKPVTFKRSMQYTFTQPKRRWVHIACKAKAEESLRLSLPLAPNRSDVMVFDGEDGEKETMRFLPAGKHTLLLRVQGTCRVDRLVVRSIPELIYANYGSNPHVKECGPYDDAFKRKYLFKNVNTFAGGASAAAAQAWRKRGGKWVVQCSVPRTIDKKPIRVDAAYNFITRHEAFKNPAFDGVIADEFGNSDPICAVYAKAWLKAHSRPKFARKFYYPYANHFYTGPEGRAFMKALKKTGSAIAWKRYLKAQPDEETARDFIRAELVARARKYRELCPGSLGTIAVCFGYFSEPPEFLNANPQANYKKYLDMQFNLVANDPAFWGTYGLMTYLASYSDEETVRWASHLFRHYGIEGNTKPATNDPYDSPHLANGDLADGTKGWTLAPAEANSIRTVHRPGFGWLQGRYPPTPEGDTALLMARSAEKPNSFSQEIKALEPGRVYTFRMFTGDYKDLSKKQKHAVTVKLDNVTLVPGRSFTHICANCYSHHHGPFNRTHKAWMNYHWYLFRATGKTGRVTVTDWAGDDNPGGPVGQQLMFNFLQVHPYFPRSGE